MRHFELCQCNKAVGLEVRDFILNVPDAKEESITDYLVWKWRLLDSRFKYINVRLCTRQEESLTTGADFELELWLIGQTECVPLLFQAKKFLKPFYSYVQKLNYRDSTQSQLSKLLSYATANKLLPFYAIYTAGGTAEPLCAGRSDPETGVYMIDALTIKDFADAKHGRKLPLSALIARSNPFHCMFCCPLGPEKHYFSSYFNVDASGGAIRSFQKLPGYVQNILSMPQDSLEHPEQAKWGQKDHLPPVRAIGVYDFRRHD